jgi:flagellar hook-associated protein 3 FlgL
MRVSTSQIFDFGAKGIGRNQFDLFKLQNQLSTGRRVLTPEDDPIAAAQALVLEQSKRVSQQFLNNQGDAKGKLGLLEGNLVGLGDLLQNVRERVVQAGNTTLSNADRSYIAQELEARFSELMGIANSQDGAGNYLFSGYQGTVKPFSAIASGAQYDGDDGQRLLQVEASRQLPTNVSGAELFNRIRQGNGTFVTATGGNGTGINQGTGIIDQGSITNLAAWNAGVNAGYGDLEVRFSVTLAGVTQYEIYDASGPTALTAPADFVPGQAIVLKNDLVAPPADFGASVVISGDPADGDTFTINSSTNQSIFATLRDTIDMLQSGIGSVAGGNSSTEFSNRLAGNLQNIDQALENVSRIRATVGSHLNELDSLASTGEDLQLQYASSLSALQDLDYTKAITDLSKKQLQLEAAQLSFRQISQLSLFKIL